MAHLTPFISDLALILGSAAVISLVFKILKQPVVLGYLLAGLIVGPNFDFFPTVVEMEGVKVWAEIGVIFLLFGLGLEFSFKKLVRMSGVSGVTAVIEVALTMLTGYFLGRMLGWNEIDCLFFGGILAIASTTIIIRSFDELGVKTQYFAGLVTGVLIFEDLVAVILMVLLTTISVSREFEGIEMLMSILKLSFFLILWFVSGIYFLPSILKASRKFLSEETLLIVSVALCMLMVVLAHQAGFSPALGAFIMGSILAETNKVERIENLTRPLKNVFGAVFFVSVGMLINVDLIIEYYVPVLLGTCVLLFAKPLFVTIGTIITGQSLKSSVQAGMSLSQIGEFSFIIASLGLTLGVISDHLYPIAVAISVITTFTTPLMIRLSNPFHLFIERKIPEKWMKSLIRYSTGVQRVAEISAWREYIRKSIVNILVYSVIIISIIMLINRYLYRIFPENELNQALTTVVTFIILTPFLWALASRGGHIGKLRNLKWNSFQRGPLIALMIIRIGLVIFFIGLLFETFYSTLVAAIGASCALVFLFVFRKKIGTYYVRIETRFMNNLNAREVEKKLGTPLAPWDSHIAAIDIHPSLSIIGQPLHQIKLRERFGINVAVIKRGELTINVPGRYEMLYPNDVVSIIGTDVDISRFKEFIESESRDVNLSSSSHEISLQHFAVNETSKLANQTIRESRIRELTNGLVVGVERNNKRILNPDSDFTIMVNDIIWLVGDEKRVQVMREQ